MPQPLADERELVNSLWTGDGGTGKTTALAAMANLGPILLVSAESGIKRRPLRNRGINVDNIQIFPDPDDPEEEISYEGLEALWLTLREQLNADPEAWVGVGWDSITEIQKRLMEVEQQRAVERASRAGRERSLFVADQDNWRTVNDQLRSLIRKFRDLPCHFGATALMRREQDDDGAVTYQPGVSPSLQNDVIGWMDVVSVTSVRQMDGEDEYLGLFKPFGKYRGKDRFDAMPRFLVDPTFDRISMYIDDELNAEDDPIMQAARERAARVKAKTGSEDHEDKE